MELHSCSQGNSSVDQSRKDCTIVVLKEVANEALPMGSPNESQNNLVDHDCVAVKHGLYEVRVDEVDEDSNLPGRAL